MKTLSLTFLVLLSSASISSAESITFEGIAPFDRTLGELTEATIFMDPPSSFTEDWCCTSTLGSMPNHSHTVDLPPIEVKGLGIFDFEPRQTFNSSSAVLAPHKHIVNFQPREWTFSGNDLTWFLQDSSPVIDEFYFAPVLTSIRDFGACCADLLHRHVYNPPPIAPVTTYVFTPIPEPYAPPLILLAFTRWVATRRCFTRAR